MIDTADIIALHDLYTDGESIHVLESNVAVDANDGDKSTQLTCMTNIMLSISGSNLLSETDSQVGCLLIRRALSYPGVRRDKEALAFCASAIGAIHVVSTNAYNRIAAQLRRKGVCELHRAIQAYAETFGREEARELRRRIEELGALASKGLSEILGNPE